MRKGTVGLCSKTPARSYLILKAGMGKDPLFASTKHHEVTQRCQFTKEKEERKGRKRTERKGKGAFGSEEEEEEREREKESSNPDFSQTHGVRLGTWAFIRRFSR